MLTLRTVVHSCLSKGNWVNIPKLGHGDRASSEVSSAATQMNLETPTIVPDRVLFSV